MFVHDKTTKSWRYYSSASVAPAKPIQLLSLFPRPRCPPFPLSRLSRFLSISRSRRNRSRSLLLTSSSHRSRLNLPSRSLSNRFISSGWKRRSSNPPGVLDPARLSAGVELTDEAAIRLEATRSASVRVRSACSRFSRAETRSALPKVDAEEEEGAHESAGGGIREELEEDGRGPRRV